MSANDERHKQQAHLHNNRRQIKNAKIDRPSSMLNKNYAEIANTDRIRQRKVRRKKNTLKAGKREQNGIQNEKDDRKCDSLVL